jgi:hypothetical protein
MEDKPKKPELVLARPDHKEDLIALFTKLSGRAPTPEGLRAKPKFAKLHACRVRRD